MSGRQRRPSALLGALLILLAGCGSPRSEAGLSEVATLVAERGAPRIHWNQGTEADHAVERWVADRLERELDADAAVQIALLNNRGLQADYARLDIAQADLVQAGLLRNPFFAGELRFGPAGTGVELSLVQDFLSIMQIPMRKRLADDALTQVTLEVAAAVIDLATATRRAFHAYQAEAQIVDLQRTVVAATAASHEYAQRLHAAGNSTDLDLAHERMLHEESRLDLASAELRTAEGRERVNQLLGVWGAATRWTAAPRLAEPLENAALPDAVEHRAVSASLDLAALKQAAVRSARQVGRLAPWWLDDAAIGVAAEREGAGDWSAGPAIEVPLPLFDRGGAAARVATARLQRDRDRFAAAAISVRSQARLALQRAQVATDRVRFIATVLLPLRRITVAETQKRYNGMLASAFHLLAARRGELAAEQSYVRALAAYWRARDDLQGVLDGRSRGVSATGGDDADDAVPDRADDTSH